MATIDLVIAGRRHELSCRDGEEAHLRRIAAMVDAKANDAARGMGGMSEARQMLFAALMLADELNDLRTATPAAAPPTDAVVAEVIEHLAERIERLSTMIADAAADRVETSGAQA